MTDSAPLNQTRPSDDSGADARNKQIDKDRFAVCAVAEDLPASSSGSSQQASFCSHTQLLPIMLPVALALSSR